MRFLEPQDMEVVSSIADLKYSIEQLVRWLKQGKKCFGVKHRGGLFAFTRCQFDIFDFYIY